VRRGVVEGECRCEHEVAGDRGADWVDGGELWLLYTGVRWWSVPGASGIIIVSRGGLGCGGGFL